METIGPIAAGLRAVYNGEDLAKLKGKQPTVGSLNTTSCGGYTLNCDSIHFWDAGIDANTRTPRNPPVLDGHFSPILE